ncbi:hypothetical protein V7Y60_07720, partial [Priestia megaterium]|uniref:hypothetical protein n=1 Tax=Priestia megaterium TaxID=1404 RepID=UPI002FFE249E
MNEVEIDVHEIAGISFSERSKYYSIKPKGAGTVYVESLASYTERLALNHNVKFDNLCEDIMKEFERDRSIVKSHYKSKVTLNGNSYTVECFVRSLAPKVGNIDLRPLTLLHLKDIIPTRAVLKKEEYWC